MNLRLKNVSSKTVRVQDSRPDCDYAIEITDSTGHALPQAECGTILRSTFLDLKPGEAKEDRIDITRGLELPAGTYTIRAARRGIYPEQPDSEFIDERAFSSSLTLTLVP